MFTDIIYNEYDNSMSLNINGLSGFVVNGLRRTILNDISNLGFGYEPENTIKIIKNTTEMNNQLLAHRISLIPVIIDEWKYSKNTINIDEYIFSLNVTSISQYKYNGNVTTDDFVVKQIKNGVETILDTKKHFIRDRKFDAPILITRFPIDDTINVINLECKLSVGTTMKHTSYSPVVICTSNKIEDKKYKFHIESVGLWYPSELLFSGILSLRKRMLNIIRNFTNIKKSYDDNLYKIIYIIEDIDTTIWNIIYQKMSQDNRFNVLHKVQTLKNNIEIQISLKSKNDLWRKCISLFFLHNTKSIFTDLNKIYNCTEQIFIQNINSI